MQGHALRPVRASAAARLDDWAAYLRDGRGPRGAGDVRSLVDRHRASSVMEPSAATPVTAA